MFQRIVVATDFSAASAAALDVAGRLAGRATTLVALNAIPPLYPDVAYANLPAAMREQQATFAIAPHTSGASVERAVVIGDPASTIVATARDTRADLIVMGVHAEHGLDHWLRGSVTERVVHEAPCHVLLVKHGRQDAARA
jgi:nucleotide-binding universal stress UspA family protein